MKRWPIVLLISLAVIVFLSPGIIGHLAEKNLDENLQWLEAENDDIVITTELFDRGWFTSAGRHRIRVTDGSLFEVLGAYGNRAGGGLPSLIIDTRLDHGLVPLTSLGREHGSLVPSIASSVSTLKIDRGDGELVALPGTIYSTFGLTGNSSFHYVMAAGSQSDADSLVTWSGADITVNTIPASRSFTIQANIEPTSLESNGVVTDVGPVTFEVSQDRSQYEFGIGTIKLEIDSLTVTSPNQPRTGFGKISLDALSELDGDRVNGRTSISFTRVLVPGIGPMNVDIGFAANGIDAGALEGIISALRAAQGSALMGAAIPTGTHAELQKLVASGLEIQFNRFDISVPQGDLSTTMTVTIPESDAKDSFSWPSVVLAMTASIDLTMSVSLYEMLQTMHPDITTLLALGVLKRNGEYYESEIRYAKGLLTINGAPMAIPLGMLQ